MTPKPHKLVSIFATVLVAAALLAITTWAVALTHGLFGCGNALPA